MTELLVQPYRESSEERVNELYALLTMYPNLNWIPPGLEISDVAARLRALHRLKTPDALQATASESKATGLITNDAVFECTDAFETLDLDRLL